MAVARLEKKGSELPIGKSYQSRLVNWLTLENSEPGSYEVKSSLSLCSCYSFDMHFEAIEEESLIFNLIF